MTLSTATRKLKDVYCPTELMSIESVDTGRDSFRINAFHRYIDCDFCIFNMSDDINDVLLGFPVYSCMRRT